jgi:uncharacterized protein (DUF1697 family)
MARLVVLLRGINVGGAKRVTMADLRALLEDLGYDDVRTHLQSGNAVIATDASPAAAEAAIAAAIADRLGLEVAVLARTGVELARIIAADRLGDVAADPAKRMVIFLPGAASTAAVRALQREDLGDERLEAAGREVYAWCPGGIGRSPLMAALAKTDIGRTGTARNWKTVTRLAEMAGGKV